MTRKVVSPRETSSGTRPPSPSKLTAIAVTQSVCIEEVLQAVAGKDKLDLIPQETLWLVVFPIPRFVSKPMAHWSEEHEEHIAVPEWSPKVAGRAASRLIAP